MESNVLAHELIDFIKNSPTAYHATAQICRRLDAAGFQPLSETASWTLVPGGKYYVTRNASSVLAFMLPQGKAISYQVVAAHSDSPAFKLKDVFDRPSPDGYLKLNVERYGGMLCSSWMDRPLGIAGRVIVATENGMQVRLLDFDRDMAIIPNVAIHMDRSANDGKSYNAQVDMLPILGVGGNDSFKKQLLDEIGVEEEQLLGHDLLLYPRDEGRVWGREDEMISAPRLDDLMCAFGAMEAFLAGGHDSVIPMLAVFDNEEVGSSTRQGAASSFLEDTLGRIELALKATGENEQEAYCRLSNSWMLSADNAHAVHPNHPEYADAQNKPRINAGIVLKFNAAQRYATDGIGGAAFRRICDRAGVRVQTYANRSDMPGGSTLGNIANTRVNLHTIDIGLPQLAMHSAYETAGTADLADYVRACTVFYHTAIRAGEGDTFAMEWSE